MVRQLQAKLIEAVRKDVDAFLDEYGVKPGLTVVIVGEDPASQVYVNRKHKVCLEVGMASAVVRLSQETAEGELLRSSTV